MAQPQVANVQRNWWDSLSKVCLTMGALVELDQRNRTVDMQNPRSSPNRRDENAVIAELGERQYVKELQQFARHGGPDMTSLKKFQYPLAEKTLLLDVSGCPSTYLTPNNRAGPHEKNFEQALEDIGIHLGERAIQPSNLEGIKVVLQKKTSKGSEQDLDKLNLNEFHDTLLDLRVDRMKEKVLHGILVDRREINKPAAEVHFDNLSELKGDTLSDAKPDLYYGLGRKQVLKLDPQVLASLDSVIVPSRDRKNPILPNMFVEFKAGELMSAVVYRQACHYGALGARAMQHLVSYGKPELIFDEVARTLTVTFCNGVLDIYAHHLAPSSNPDLPFECYMTHVQGWNMKNSLEEMKNGVRGYRNARNWARDRREMLIRRTNNVLGYRSPAPSEELGD